MVSNASTIQLNQDDGRNDTANQSYTRTHTRAVSGPAEVSQNTSLGGWVKTIFPSNRPERGGTIRNQGFWTKHPSGNSSDTQKPGSEPPNHYRREYSGTGDSSYLVEWNIPQTVDKPLLRNNIPRPRHRAASAGSSALLDPDADRRWSWVPRDDAEYWKMYKKFGKRQDPERLVDDTSKPPMSPVTKTLLSLQARRDARKERKSLKESGDYLGVQGFNPSTRVPDVITPSDSDQSTNGQEIAQKLDALKQLSRDLPSPSSKKKIDKEIRKVLLEKEGVGFVRREQAKAALQRAHSRIRWRRHSKQWSSAQEPDLSPIAQSHSSTTPPTSKSCHFHFEAGTD